MSLIPSAVNGSPNDLYFTLDVQGRIASPTVVPLNESSAAAALNISNLLDTSVTKFVVKTTGGGLTAQHAMEFMYGGQVGGSGVGLVSDAYGLGPGNGYVLTSINLGRPLDSARVGQITGTGAAQVVAVPSIIASSFVSLAFVGGTPAAGAVAVTITPNTSFSLTLPAGAVYNYQVIG